MKIDLKSQRVQTDILGIVFSMIMAAVVLPHARQAQSPVLFVIIFGGLSVGLPLGMAIGCLTGHLPVGGERKRRQDYNNSLTAETWLIR
jgi:uncharacterized membrane protein YedE/YeeE